MTTETIEKVPWTQKYRPKTLSQVADNEKAVQKILDWLKRWESLPPGKRKGLKRAALVFGPPGTGKTVMVEAIANDYGYTLVETNASDFRTPDQIDRWVSRSIESQTLESTLYRVRERGRLILFDEVDGIAGREDRGGVGAVIEVIKKTSHPVILTANDIYQPKLRSLRSHCFEVGLQRLSEGTIASYLKKICDYEGIKAEAEALTLVARNAGGDMRAAINDLQALSEGRKTLTAKDVIVYMRDPQVQTFDALRRFFAAKTWFDARGAIEEATVDYEIMMLCIHESLPYQFKEPRDLANAYELLSRADVFLNRAQSQRAWRLLKYFFDLTTGIPFVRRHGWPSNYVRFSQKMTQMSRSRARRKMMKDIELLIGAKCHVSSRIAKKEFLPYIKVIFRNDPSLAAKMSSWFSFDGKMISYLKNERE